MKKKISIVFLVLIFCAAISYAESSPSISKISDLEILEDHKSEPIAFTISDADGITGIAVSVSASNTMLIKNENIRLNGSQTLMIIQPEKDQHGQSIITLTANNTNNLTAISSFCLTVISVNDPPEFVPGDSIQLTSTSESQIFTQWAKDISPGIFENAQSLSFYLTTNSANMFVVPPRIQADGTLTFTPDPNISGIAEVAVYLQDDGGTDNDGKDKSETFYFTIEIKEKPQPTSFVIADNVTVLEDSNLTEIQNFLSITKTNSDAISFHVIDNNPELFENRPQITSDGALSFKPAQDSFGMAIVTVVLFTGDGIDESSFTSEPQTFTLTVLSVNDPPSFLPGANYFEYEDSGEQTYAWASHIKAGPLNESNQTLEFHIQEIDRPELFEILPEISSEGLIHYKLASDAYGTAQIKVHLQDNGGTQNNGIDTSETKTFTLEIFSINDCPSFMIGSDITIYNRSGEQLITQWITDISMGANEPNQTGTFHLSIDNENLFEQKPMLSEDYGLRFSPDPSSTGTAMITISLTDDGGTDRNGCNTTEKSFAIYIEPTKYTLTVLIQGEGSIVLNDLLLDETAWENSFLADDVISLEAIPLTGWLFSNWSESLTHTNAIATVEMNDHKTLIAHFKPEPRQLTVKGKGWMMLNDQYFKLPCSHELDRNEVIEVTAMGLFSHWSGDITSSSNSVTLTMNTNKEIYAHCLHSDRWNAKFQLISTNREIAPAQDIQYEDDITIGVDIESKNVLDIQSPLYTCRMFIFSPNDEEYLSSSVFKEGQDNYQWHISIQPHGNIGDIQSDASVILKWQPFELNIDGQFQLIKGFDSSGDVIIEDMTAINEYAITGNAAQFYTIQWIRNSYTFDLSEGWNLISLPLIPDNPNLSVLFPDIDVAYAYIDGSYELVRDLEAGCGYWIEVPENQTYTIYGKPFSESKIFLASGWHMSGAISTGAIPETLPKNAISVIYNFKDGAYQEVNEIKSTFGFWIYITEPCEFILDK